MPWAMYLIKKSLFLYVSCNYLFLHARGHVLPKLRCMACVSRMIFHVFDGAMI